jgi:hypothetical protein
MFSQNFSIIGAITRELHLLKVEGVEIFIFISKLVKIAFCFET